MIQVADLAAFGSLRFELLLVEVTLTSKLNDVKDVEFA